MNTINKSKVKEYISKHSEFLKKCTMQALICDIYEKFVCKGEFRMEVSAYDKLLLFDMHHGKASCCVFIFRSHYRFIKFHTESRHQDIENIWNSDDGMNDE